jgi:plasmid stabilization system protein ParE
MKRVRNHPSADADLLDATRWYVERSYSAASGFIREVEHAMNRIAETPNRYPRTRLGCRRFVLMNYPYDIVYRELGDEIEIVAVAHHARKPMYWRRR